VDLADELVMPCSACASWAKAASMSSQDWKRAASMNSAGTSSLSMRRGWLFKQERSASPARVRSGSLDWGQRESAISNDLKYAGSEARSWRKWPTNQLPERGSSTGVPCSRPGRHCCVERMRKRSRNPEGPSPMTIIDSQVYVYEEHAEATLAQRAELARSRHR
jgi:hypothetical protein